MCGIAGFIGSASTNQHESVLQLRRMTDAIAHRGPDGHGQWICEEGRVGLGHRRLSIIDLSDSGSQPMTSPSGRYVIVFNGEIYAFLEHRARLEAKGYVFRGTSDTEVLLNAIEDVGVEDALAEMNGMFAFAVFDRQRGTLHLARDRMGKKPLYVGVAAGAVVFASELKAVRAHPAFHDVEINAAALSSYVRFGYVPSPLCIYDGVIKLPAGFSLTVHMDALPTSQAALLDQATRYWSLAAVAEAGRASRITDEAEAIDTLDRILGEAVAERMIADVPIGSFLSSGIDSALVTAMMQETAERPVRTFTVRFAEASHNEADAAADIANYLGTEHTELAATPASALESVHHLSGVYDEPLSDPSQIPTLLLTRLAREHVKVAISGDGGDESFGGYNRYAQMMTFERMGRFAPAWAWKAAGGMPPSVFDTLAATGRLALPAATARDLTGDRLAKLCTLMSGTSFQSRYRNFHSEFQAPGEVLAVADRDTAADELTLPAELTSLETMMYLDAVRYLVDAVLVKVDRASMATGLELRSPLLDRKVVEFAWRLPEALRSDGRTGKIALRKLLARRLPQSMFDRPKRGFGVPLNDWLRGPLRDWTEASLSTDRLTRDGYFNPKAVRRYVDEHMAGTRNWGSRLWTLCAFNAWSERWMSR